MSLNEKYIPKPPMDYAPEPEEYEPTEPTLAEVVVIGLFVIASAIITALGIWKAWELLA